MEGQLMDCKAIEQRLTEQLQLTEVYVKTDGSHYAVTAVGSCFEGLSRVKQQQLVYAPLMEEITAGTIHALQIKAFTPEQWRREKLLNPPV
jgi:acid stress-induced BolA-like protein IbaG/YrbA